MCEPLLCFSFPWEPTQHVLEKYGGCSPLCTCIGPPVTDEPPRAKASLQKEQVKSSVTTKEQERKKNTPVIYDTVTLGKAFF